MTPRQRQEITRYLEAFDFSVLFTDATVGWDWAKGGEKLTVPTKAGYLKLDVVAEKRGVKVLHIPPGEDGKLRTSVERRTLEKAIRPLPARERSPIILSSVGVAFQLVVGMAVSPSEAKLQQSCRLLSNPSS